MISPLDSEDELTSQYNRIVKALSLTTLKLNHINETRFYTRMQCAKDTGNINLFNRFKEDVTKNAIPNEARNFEFFYITKSISSKKAIIPPALEYQKLKNPNFSLVAHTKALSLEDIAKRLKRAFPEEYDAVKTTEIIRYISGNNPLEPLKRNFVTLIIKNPYGSIVLVQYKGSDDWVLPREPVREGETNEDALKRLKKKFNVT
jgi:ribosomal protein S21